MLHMRKENIFKGKRFALTGKLKNLEHHEAKKLIEERGGIIEDSVTHETHYLVVGSSEDETTTINHAKIHETSIMLEDEFYMHLALIESYVQMSFL